MSMGIVNKDTAATIPAAGNTEDKIGNMAELHTTAKSDIVAAVNEVTDEQANKADNDEVAPEFNDETAYSAGELVYKDGQLYKFDSDHAAGAWDASEVSTTTVAAEFNQLKNTLTSTEERLNSNILGSPVNIISYTSANKYTFPADGYVQIRSEQAGSYITARINGIAWISRQGASDYQLLYVKKGMTFYVYSMDGNAEAYFCPLQSS